MRRLMKIVSLMTGVMVLCVLMLSVASAQTAPIKISLVASKISYLERASRSNWGLR